MIHKERKKGPIITTVQQAKRLIKIVIGFSVLLVGCIMIVTPGPGMAAIVGGLAILATEFVWAKKTYESLQGRRESSEKFYFEQF